MAEKARLQKLDTFLLIEYIRSSIEIAMNMNTEQKEESHNLGKSEEASIQDIRKGYEIVIQKLEEEVRGHIRIEQQLKVQMEALQFKLDESMNQYNIEKNAMQQVTPFIIIFLKGN